LGSLILSACKTELRVLHMPRKKGRKNEEIMKLVFIAIFILFLLTQRVRLIFFTNDRCEAAKTVENALIELKQAFGPRVEVERYEIHIFEDDPPDSPEVVKLRKEYGIYGVPSIVVGGKLINDRYTKERLLELICARFIIKPGACR